MHEGDASRILTILKQYKRELPTDFVANVIGKQEGEITSVLENLQNHGVIDIQGSKIRIRQI